MLRIMIIVITMILTRLITNSSRLGTGDLMNKGPELGAILELPKHAVNARVSDMLQVVG